MSQLNLKPLITQTDEDSIDFEDRVLVRDVSKRIKIDNVMHDKIYYHTANYSTSNLDINKHCIETIIKYLRGGSALNQLEVCVDVEGARYGSLGLALKGEVLAIIDEDLYSCKGKDGSREMPRALISKLESNFDNLKDSSQLEIVLDVTSIEYLWYDTSRIETGELEIIKDISLKWGIPLVDATGMKDKM